MNIREWIEIPPEWYWDMKSAVFLIILVYAVWQDMKYRSLGGRFLLFSGVVGALIFASSGQEWKTAVLSIAPGILILILCRVTDGGIGEGDGWFFVVTGFFLDPEENIFLFLSGLAFCGIFGLILVVSVFAGGGSVRKRRLPFLPCLLPAGLWLALI